MLVLIVTANVPTVQPLFRAVLGIHSTGGTQSYSLRPTPKAKGTDGSRDASGRGLEYPDSIVMNTSSDHILPADSSHPGGIVRTKDYSLTYN